MKISNVSIRNFRRLENVSIDIEDRETVFVGPNNSGKTSATAIFRCFLGGRNFCIHDFSVSRIADFNTFAESGDDEQLPRIELDIWFSIDPNSIAFGRAFSLLPRLSEFDRLGVRLSYGANEPKTLRTSYELAYPLRAEGTRDRTFSQYLALDGNLKRHYEVSYFSLEQKETNTIATRLGREEGKKLLQNLLRVDFVDAQRNIDDDDSNRSNHLSVAFASFYRKNLEQAETAAEAQKVIDDNNQQLTEHYAKQFDPLITLIKGLGVPSINDRILKIISSLSPESVLRGNITLLYVDPVRQHELPELYNGLGFKNLIYMAIQARHFHSQWMRTAENRPLCQLIFVEEPEVHLHAQVQQTFIRNVWSVIEQSAREGGEEELVPQIVVTTHSSHILDAAKFEEVRYFRRCQLEGEVGSPGILNASEVRSLRTFRPDPETIDSKFVTPEESLVFLGQYLRLTHCDLFFADGVVLVEGAAEKLLLPAMIDKVAAALRSTYLTILEVGGAYAHRFESLLSFLRIPYLIVTDLDSVEATGNHKACRANTAGAHTSNETLKKFCGVTTVAELMSLTPAQKEDNARDRCIAFQIDIPVTDGPTTQFLRPRTFEEAMVYQNASSAESMG
jgi:predicted ATP-dependent endonuclease of OLD family